ncbi:MAG: YkgJ family cysteine cluster protein [Planctomycetota bacterium]
MSGDRADYPFRFSCRRSGNCCAVPGGFVRVSAGEAAAIAAHLELSVEAFSRRYLTADGERLRDGVVTGRCVFLRDGAAAACSIYPARPQKCRDWPYWPEALEDPALMARILRTCPGVEAT